MTALTMDGRSVVLNDFVAQWNDVGQEAMGALERVGKSGWLVLGEEVRSFEAELATVLGLPHVVGCGNGLDAIELSLRALGLKPGDHVLTTPLSAFATTLAIVRAGGIPVFVDVDDSGLINLERCADVLHEHRRIRYFVPVHLFGHALDANQLDELVRRFDVRVVEDCAQSIGAKSHGRAVGSIGKMAATSFYPTKNLGCMGDGGAVLTRDAGLAATVRCLRDYGQKSKYDHQSLGMNSRLDELQAAIMRSAFLPRLQRHTERRCAIAAAYKSGIRHSNLTIPATPPGSASVWHLFPLVVDGDRDDFAAHLKRRGVGTGVHYPTIIPRQGALDGVESHTHGALTNALSFAQRELSLPIHPYLSDDDVQHVIDACNGWRR